MDKEKKIKPKKTRAQRRHRRRVILNSIMIFIIVCGITGLAVGGTIIYSILNKSTISLDVTDFQSADSSIIYDSDGEIIATVGLENRINISYDKLPQCVIDAFVSIEDSRFFEHPGFDIPRFTKALIENIRTMSFGQGGSTFTMQMVKNTYFVTEESLAEKSINRKVQEIYLALQVEKLISKKKIFELYINKINFGGTARGIQSASHYYFGKECYELTLNEAATLAGVINAPNLYNPYYNVDYCEERRNEVLNLMVYHGYITEEEAAINKKINVEDLLVGDEQGIVGETEPLQSYVDQVLNEFEELTGEDPYTAAARIYTAMDRKTQDAADNICAGKTIKFPNDYFQTGFAVVNNKNGEIIALGGGRGRTGERTFSFATDARKNPGSSMKVVLPYPLAFEYGGVSTQDYVVDAPINWEYTTIQVWNASRKYFGCIRLQRCLSASLNIPAVLMLRKARTIMSDKQIIQYLKNLGFDKEVANLFNEQYSIGGSDMVASPLQMAAAQAMIFNGGIYTTPHCIRRIEYINGSQEPYEPTYTGVRLISAAAAYCVAYMMEKNVSNDIYLGNVKIVKKSYPVYAKTGTSDWGSGLEKYNIPDGAAKDHWFNSSTSKFTIATWCGYDKIVKGKPSYLTSGVYKQNITGQISSKMLDAVAKSFGTPKAVSKPSSVISETHVKGTWPYRKAPSWCPENMITTGMAKAVTIKEWITPTIDQIYYFASTLNSCNTDYSSGTAVTSLNFTFEFGDYPGVIPDYKVDTSGLGLYENYLADKVDGVISDTVRIFLNGRCIFAKCLTDEESRTMTITVEGLDPGTYEVTVQGLYAYSIAPVECAPIVKTHTFTVTEAPVTPTPDPQVNP